MAEDIYAVVRAGKVLRNRAYLKKGHATLAANAYPNSREVKKGQVVWDGTGEVVISLEEYNRLLERDNELSLLEGYGVDNWEGYYDALNNTGQICKED